MVMTTLIAARTTRKAKAKLTASYQVLQTGAFELEGLIIDHGEGNGDGDGDGDGREPDTYLDSFSDEPDSAREQGRAKGNLVPAGSSGSQEKSSKGRIGAKVTVSGPSAVAPPVVVNRRVAKVSISSEAQGESERLHSAPPTFSIFRSTDDNREEGMDAEDYADIGHKVKDEIVPSAGVARTTGTAGQGGGGKNGGREERGRGRGVKGGVGMRAAATGSSAEMADAASAVSAASLARAVLARRKKQASLPAAILHSAIPGRSRGIAGAGGGAFTYVGAKSRRMTRAAPPSIS